MRLRLHLRNRVVSSTLAVFLIALATIGAMAFAPAPALLEKTPFSTAYYDRNGVLLRLTLADDDKFRLFTPLERISPELVTATLRQEDRYFYHHPGVNPLAMIRAAYETYITRSRRMGGSTITMQVVRLRDDLDTRTLHGKLAQVTRALRLERAYDKDRILEAYLNLAPYGGNIHGAGAASLIYFGKPARALVMPQSLALAVIPQNPAKRNPLGNDMTAWHEARPRLFERLPDSFAAYAAQINMPLPVNKREDLPFSAPHFINALPPLAGARVDTTLDSRMQGLLERHIAAWLARERWRGLDNAAAILVHAPSMEVRALAGSGSFFNKAIAGQVDGTAARRSPGSTLKPFVYALAMDQGLIHPGTLLSDDPAYFAEYRPGNFDDRFIGMIPAGEALHLSRNVPAIALSARLRNPGLYQFLQEAGAALPQREAHYGLSLAVGGAEVDMRTIARLYAMLANGGMMRDLVYIKGQTTNAPRAMISPESAYLTLTMLERPDPDALPFTAERALPVYWKTGTSNGFRDAWTVGVFGPYVLALWTGHFDGRQNPAFVGVEIAAPSFFELVSAIERQEALHDTVHPAMSALNIARVGLCRQTGTINNCGEGYTGWFIPGKSPIATASALPAKPEILSPRAGLSYVVSRKSAEPLRIPLEARNEAGGGTAYWFAGTRYLGKTAESTPLFWSPPPGHHVIRYVDSQGRTAAQEITVLAGE